MFFGHPLDTIKTRMMQDSGRYRGNLDCALNTLRNEGIRGFWKGLGPPMASIAVYQAVIFAAFSVSLPVFTDKPEETAELTPLFLAGCVAGLATVPITTPTDLIKIRLQLQTEASGRYKGPIDCVTSIIRKEGLKGMFRGGWVTACRDSYSSGLYFVSYHQSKRLLAPFDLLLPNELISGGIAGICAWGSIIPLDVIKTRVQAGNLSIIEATRSVVANGNTSAFFRGSGALLSRAFVVNAVTFYVYEHLWRM